MPEYAKLLSKRTFYWDKNAAMAMMNAVDQQGNVNWRNAMAADPGVSKCPECGTFCWNEAALLQCPKCQTKWSTATKEKLTEEEEALLTLDYFRKALERNAGLTALIAEILASLSMEQNQEFSIEELSPHVENWRERLSRLS